MKLIRTGKAGTLESSDVMITVKNNPANTIEINLKSIVEKQFGRHIRSFVESVLEEMEVTSAIVDIDDRSALDCVIKARLETALYRAAGITVFQWEKIR
ncbi:MAG: citrate lyase acyl carrier protein [Sediminispirochaetaceae bacterium]